MTDKEKEELDEAVKRFNAPIDGIWHVEVRCQLKTKKFRLTTVCRFDEEGKSIEESAMLHTRNQLMKKQKIAKKNLEGLKILNIKKLNYLSHPNETSKT